MAMEDRKLADAKESYRRAKAVGNRQEEARWANVIGDILKNIGEYVKALYWLRIDYDVSRNYLSEKHTLPTCQSLGEVNLRLGDYTEALKFQKEHLKLAKDSDDLVEQQRANTQLGRTYYEKYSKSEDDHRAIRKAKEYFSEAMELAKVLKEKPLPGSGSFIKEYVDAHNNIGMLEMDLDNHEEAQRILTRGLEICDEEEVSDNDDARSRLNHNLGNVYLELRKWEKAREHIEKDIIICRNIGQCQGEAKGYINLGEYHYRCQMYEEAISCYKKAQALASSLQDENALADQIDHNIETVHEAIKVMDDLKKEEQNLKKLTRNMVMERGTSNERKGLIKQNECLDRLLEKSSMILAWDKHLELAKKKKRVTIELGDKEKLGDSYSLIGESYNKLRMFKKSLKWYSKSWEIYQSVRNLEGQALVKTNIGNILDSAGNSTGAMKAYEDGYRMALEANLPSAQLSALENMHYIQMIRLDNIEEARRLQQKIDKLKQSKDIQLKSQNGTTDFCSETDTEGDDHIPHINYDETFSPKSVRSNISNSKSRSLSNLEPQEEDETLISIFQSARKSSKPNADYGENLRSSKKTVVASPVSLSKSTSSQQTPVGRKRVRVVLSDDEDEIYEESHKKAEDIATSDDFIHKSVTGGNACKVQDASTASNCAMSSYTPISRDENTLGSKSRSPTLICQNGELPRSLNIEEIRDEHIMCKVGDDLITIEAGSLLKGDNPSTESLKLEVACIYFLQLPVEKRSKGLLPIIRSMECDGQPLETLESSQNLKDIVKNNCLEASIEGWIQKPLMKFYVDSCKDFSEIPNLKLLKRLYDLEVSEDEVIVAECDLQDISIKPLLSALHTLKAVSMIDLSHNMIGNGTMEELQQILSSSGQTYGGLSLDLHCNRLGSTALFQICECPVLFARLEVLNLSGNRLTDACGSYLSRILDRCKALYSLNIERCSITSRTIQKVADSLNAESSLTQLRIGQNSPISANVLAYLLAKLEVVERFSALSLTGIKLSKSVVDKLCKFIEASCLSGLMLGSTYLGRDGALQLIENLASGNQELVKLDLSHCNLTSECIVSLNKTADFINGITELNLGGNSIGLEGRNALTSFLSKSHCTLKVLLLENCHLGLAGIVQIIQTLEVNGDLEELSLAHNADLHALGSATNSSMDTCNISPREDQHNEVDKLPQSADLGNLDYNDLEVADSEDELIMDEPAVSKGNHSFSGSSQRKGSSVNHDFIQELSSAISKAKNLKFLDLSNNGFGTQDIELLYSTWLNTRAGLTQRHVKDQMFHLSMQGVKCCSVKPCCRRDAFS